jgi:uncharacterized delta-60 repeat protein
VVARPRIGVALALGIVLVLALGGGRAQAMPGQVDPRYGYNGTLDITDALPGPEFHRGVLAEAVGPQDESVVLSYATRPCPVDATCADLYVTRVLRDGTVDTGFGARAGVVATVEWGAPHGAGEGPHGAIAVQPDGKVVVAAGDAISARVARLNPDGSHDPTFRNPAEPGRPAGEVSVLLGGATTVTDLAIREGGEVVVAGCSWSGRPGFFVAQLLSDGQRDEQFGLHGIRFDNFQPGGVPGDIALRGATTIVGGTASYAESGSSMALAELDATGTLSRAIRVRLPKRVGAGKPKGIASVLPGPKGSTFVVGSAVKGTFVAKYGRDGKLDRGYRDGGYALLKGLTSETPSSAVIDSKGRVIVLGWRPDVPDTMGFRARYASTVRLLPSGRVDPTYGGVRPLLVVEERGQKIGLDISRSVGLVQRSDGMLVMLGEAPADRYARVPTGPNFGLVRYLAGGRLP